MLVPNRNIWETRIQAVEALVTAAAGDRKEIYYLATACQVGLDPVLISISPNPEYPICAVIERSGFFGIHFLADSQANLVERCIGLRRSIRDKVAALGLDYELTRNGTPLLRDCLQAIECRIVEGRDSGDHRTYVGQVTERLPRPRWLGERPRRFGGDDPASRRVAKAVLCRSRLYDLVLLARRLFSPPTSVEEGTRLMVRRSSMGRPETSAAESRLSRAGVRPPTPGICLVGCGGWGAVHAVELRRLGTQIRRYFASRDPVKALEFARRYDGEALASFDAALADARVDAVLLSLPHDLHARAALRALEAGKHVLVEKPLALTAEDGGRLVQAAESSGRCLAVAEQYRLSPLVTRAKEIIAEGRLGRILLVHGGAAARYRPEQGWKREREAMGGGVLIDVGVHYVDVLRFWFGEPGRVLAFEPPQLVSELEGEDSAALALEFRDGPVASLHLSWAGFRRPEAPHFEVIGEHGSLALWFRRPYLQLAFPLPAAHWSRRARRMLPWRIERRLEPLFPRSRAARIRVRAADLGGSRALIEDFVRAITTGSAPAVPGHEGLKDLQVVLGAYRSLATGSPVRLDVAGNRG